MNIKNLCIVALTCGLAGAALGALGMGTVGIILCCGLLGGALSGRYPILE